MKRLILFLAVLSLACVSALADPLPLLENASGEISEQYENGSFLFRYSYPRVDDDAEGGAEINAFISQELIDLTLEFYVPMIQETCENEGGDFSIVISSSVTCNNDEYFSFLSATEKVIPDEDGAGIHYDGYVFSRKNGGNGMTYTLPKYLGILESNENDTWIQDRQTGKADTLIREMVWAMIEENTDGVSYYSGFTREELEAQLFPEENYYLDENGDPVFYLQPGVAAPEEAGLLTFTIPLEDILDEL